MRRRRDLVTSKFLSEISRDPASLTLVAKRHKCFVPAFKSHKYLRYIRKLKNMQKTVIFSFAETERFELSNELPRCLFSKQVPSTTQPRLQCVSFT